MHPQRSQKRLVDKRCFLYVEETLWHLPFSHIVQKAGGVESPGM